MTPQQLDAFCTEMHALEYGTVESAAVECPRDLWVADRDLDRKGLWRFVRPLHGTPRSTQNYQGALPEIGVPGPEPDLHAQYEYDSVRQVDYYRLRALSKPAVLWLVEHPPGGPEHNTVAHRRAGQYFLAAARANLRIRVE